MAAKGNSAPATPLKGSNGAPIAIEQIPIDELKAYEKHARSHPPSQITKIAASIKEFQFVVPCLIDKNNVIIAGHARVLAAKEAGLRIIPCIRADHLTDTQVKALRLHDNRVAQDANWLDDLLRDELAALKELDFDLALTGFDDRELIKLMADDADLARAEETPDVPENPASVTGDVWLAGPHRLLCGDNAEPHNWDKLMGADKARLVVTSPPYNQKLNTFKPSGMQKESPAFVKRMANSYADDLPEDKYREGQLERFALIATYMTEDASLFYNHKVRYRDKQVIHPYEIVATFPLNIRQEIIWNRSSSITLNARMFVPCDERIYWMTKSETFVFNDHVDIKKQSSVWTFAARNEVAVSAAFPVELPKRCIEAASIKGDVVAEPYSGSGTTMMAAHIGGRVCRAMEINPAYCDVAVIRWQDYTGEQATLEGDGRTFDEIKALRHGNKDKAAAA